MTALGLTFHSVLAEPITVYVKAKCAIGCRFAGEARSLRLLDRFLVAQRVATMDAISSDVIDAFLVSRPRREARSYNDLLGTVRRFFEWMVTQQMLSVSPVRATRRREGPRRRPFLFSVSQMRQLLDIGSTAPGSQPWAATRPDVLRDLCRVVRPRSARGRGLASVHRRSRSRAASPVDS